jgi:hypothetical protein
MYEKGGRWKEEGIGCLKAQDGVHLGLDVFRSVVAYK